MTKSVMQSLISLDTTPRYLDIFSPYILLQEGDSSTLLVAVHESGDTGLELTSGFILSLHLFNLLAMNTTAIK